MANVLPFALRVKIVASLVEGTSIRATARENGVDKDTVMHLGVAIGLACLVLHDRRVRKVRASLLEVDEVWAYVGKHQRRLLPTDPATWGDHYTMFAIDPVSKVVPSFLTGRRDLATATAFACDLRERIVGKPQVSVDGWPHWPAAFLRAFKWNGVDLAVISKEYRTDDERTPGRSRVKYMHKFPALGTPDMDDVSTSKAERLNLTSRMHQRRLTRLTNAFSKKPENLRAALGLHFAWYNLVRVHETIGTTPAVAAGLADAPWSLAELVAAALAIADETPEPTAPAPAPSPTATTEPAPLPTWGAWREPVQLPLPGVEPANDVAPAVEVDDEAPVTVRELVPWGECAGDWGP